MALKFKEPQVIRATYRIVTPMFIGDAEQKASGISPASVKGALRFWWRALRWGQIRLTVQSDTAALQRLHQEEGQLFGTSADNGNAAQFTLQVISDNKPAVLTHPPQVGIQYLLGQGLYRAVYLRPALAEGSSLSIELFVNPKSDKQTQADYDIQKIQLTQALLALGLLGGLGSRARKGFGSLSIESLTHGKDIVAIPQNVDELKRIISGWISPVGVPPFTAFSKQTRIDVAAQGTKPLDVLNKVGEEQQLYRSYGQAGLVHGKKAEKRFKKDHDLVLDVIRNKNANNRIPERSVFGLPHNYFFSSEFNKIKNEALAKGLSEQDAKREARYKSQAEFSVSVRDRTRRASPLFIHVHQFPNNQVVVIQSLFPAEFLPDRTTLEFKMGNRPNDRVQVLFNEQAMINWQVIHTYMDRFANKVRVL